MKVSAQNIRIGIFPFKPISFVNKIGHAQSLNSLTIKRFAEEHNWQLTFSEESWSEGLARLQDGEIDLAMSAAYTHQWANELDYSMQSSMEALDARINISELTGRLVAIMRHDISGQNFFKKAQSHGVSLDVKEVTSFRDVLKVLFLAIGGIALLLGSSLVGKNKIKKRTVELRRSEERFKAVLQKAPAGIGVVRERIFEEVNQHFCDMTGYTEKDLIGKSWRIFYATQEEHDFFAKELYGPEVGTKPRKLETSWQRKDGHIIDVFLTVSPMCSLDLSQGSVFIAMDISDKKMFEHNLRKSEENFRTLFEQSCDPTFLVDLSGRFQDVNQQASKTLGFSRAELLNMGISDIDECFKFEEFTGCLDNIMQGNFPVIMNRVHRCKSGKLLDVEVSASPIIIHGKTLVISIARDLTYRKRFEADLISSKERYAILYNQFRSILESISDPLILLSSDMKKLWSNTAYDKLHEETVGKDRDNQSCVGFLKRPAEQCIKNGELTEEVICSLNKRLWGVKVFPLKEIQKDGIHALIIASDITEKVKLREEVTRMNRLASLGELAAGIAHEINNPNAIILLNMPIIKDAFSDAEAILHAHYRQHGELSLAGFDFAEIKQELPVLIDRVQQGAERIERIVGELKKFIRNEAEQEYDLVDLNDIVSAGIRLLEHRIKKTTDYFSFKSEKNLPPVKGSFQKLEQVVVNLIQNACEALTERWQAVEVETRLDQDSNTVILRVHDQGRGIKEEDLTRILDPFYTTKRHCGGTGLGLSVSARILQEHRAKLHIESDLGQGSIFMISIPAYKKED